MKYRFDQIAINSTVKKKPIDADKEHYIGLEHLDSDCLIVSRWGAEVTPIGEKLLMQKGDILFGKRRAYQRKVGIAPFDGIFSAHGMVLRPKENVVIKEFFPFFIASDQFMERAVRISVGGLSPTINWRDLKEQEFELPSLEEQRILSEKLWAAYRLKESYKRLLAATDEMVKSQFIEMFGNPVTNSKSWQTKAIMEVAPEQPSKKRMQGKVWLLNLDMIESNTGKVIEKVYETSENTLSVQPFDEGNVLFSKLRPYLNKVVVPDEYGLATTELVPLRPNQEKLHKVFLSYLLRSQQFVTFANKISGGTKMPRMPLAELRKFECILPPMSEQLKFVGITEQADKSKFELRKSIDAIDQVIKSLING
ncbi:restriction endonuclease subunit S [Bacteroides gallinaceum]|uniref:restriction endonuclease subunit S n=1 Tax=Bacteroides gallinaceum TaxID=1462571 RepID=UPI00195B23CA|nr:restriction endonuclease subunit S [Bacteroides gallinaceum]MBM6719403.1 restriction endonuclease subunit S [Bacteroides gallinaceum]